MTSVRPTGPTRRRPCKVCRLPASEADLVNGGLLLGWSARSLAAKFTSISRRNVAYHAKNCLSEAGKEE